MNPGWTTTASAEDATAATRGPELGRILDARYRLDRILGAGGVGVVYEAFDLRETQSVALKMLREGYEDSEAMRRRFDREAKALQTLRHPRIVPLLDHGFAEGTPYLVMERLDGQALDERLETALPSPTRALELFGQFLEGLSFVHQAGIVHRDIKPANLFLVGDGLRLLDFGLAKMLVVDDADEGPREATLTRAGTILGTPAYMAPEQAAGSPVAMAADVYSAGVLLFELLTGRPPFVEARRTDLLRAHLVQPVPDPGDLRRGLRLSRELQALLLRALAKEPQERFQDAGAMLAAFRELGDGAAHYERPEDPDVTREIHEQPSPLRLANEGTPAPPGPPRRSNPMLAAAGVVAAGAVLLGVWRFAGPTQDAPEQPESVAAPAAPAEPADPSPTLEQLPEPLQRQADALEGPRLNRNAHRQLRSYQRAHPDDARPSLLIAGDLSRRGLHTKAVERYRLAVHRDHDATRFPALLEGLVAAAADEESHRVATAALEELFDDPALPIAALQSALAETENRTERRLLRRAKRRLEREAP